VITSYLLLSLFCSGPLDGGFGNNGIKTYKFGTTTIFSDFVEQEDGKLVVVGEAYTNVQDFLVMRLNRDGSLDTSFSGNGWLSRHKGGNDFLNSVALTAEGNILAAGYYLSGTRSAFLCFDNNGDLYPGFSDDGELYLSLGYQSFRVFDMVIQADGKILATGYLKRGASERREMFVLRLEANGSLDTTFGYHEDGLEIPDLVIEDTVARTISTCPDGGMLVSGYMGDQGSRNGFLVKLTQTGELDANFTGGGFVLMDLGGDNVWYQSHVLEDGRILVAGRVEEGSASDGVLACFLADGTPDPDFGNGGVVYSAELAYNQNLSVAYRQGALYAAGTTGAITNGRNGKLTFQKCSNEGQLDPDYGTAGVLSIDHGGQELIYKSGFLRNGKLLSVGYSKVTTHKHGILVGQWGQYLEEIEVEEWPNLNVADLVQRFNLNP